MPVLPLIDLLILMGWTSLLVGFAQKAIWISTHYRPNLFGLSPMDFVMVAGICLVFALALAARTWVKLNEPRLQAVQRHLAHAQAQRAHEEAEAAAVRAERAPSGGAGVTPIGAGPQNG